MKKIFLLTVLSLMLFSNVRSQNDNPVLFKVTGLWTGTMPCADCESISYRLNLRRNLTFIDQIIYEGKDVSNLISDGSWRFLNDSTIELNSSSGTKSTYRLTSASEMVMLDNNGERLIGSQPGMFRLTKLSREGSQDDMNENKGFENAGKIREEKRKSGVNFVAYGNEPYWNVEIDLDKSIKLKALFDIEEMNFPTPQMYPIMDVAGVSYISSNDEATINVSIFKQDCSDDMSGENFSYHVTADIQFKNNSPSKIFTGCGMYLNDAAVNKVWTLEKINGKKISKKDFDNSLPSMKLDLTESKISGNAGCNSYTGVVDGQGDMLKFGYDFAMTRMFCDNMDFEKKFMETITGKTLIYEVAEGKLKLKDRDTVVMEFRDTTE
ncbi:MAG: META domain-containing protein [bacterium]